MLRLRVVQCSCTQCEGEGELLHQLFICLHNDWLSSEMVQTPAASVYCVHEQDILSALLQSTHL